MDWKSLIKKFEAEMELFLAYLPSAYPKAVQANNRTPGDVLDSLVQMERNFSERIDAACRDYARNGRFQSKLSHEELYLLQPRFYEAAILCCLFDTPARAEDTHQLFEPPQDQTELIEWLLVSAWHIQGSEQWLLREEAIARRVFQNPPSNGR